MAPSEAKGRPRGYIAVGQSRSRNHLIDQVESFRIGDKDNRREDDLLDCFCYGVAITLGDRQGF